MKTIKAMAAIGIAAMMLALSGCEQKSSVALVMLVQRATRGLRSGKSSEGSQVKPVRGQMSVRS